jgi:hypothetical protein
MKSMKVNLQDEKHDLHKCVTDDGITIVVNPEENAYSSIHCKGDPHSDQIEESERQSERLDFATIEAGKKR